MAAGCTGFAFTGPESAKLKKCHRDEKYFNVIIIFSVIINCKLITFKIFIYFYFAYLECMHSICNYLKNWNFMSNRKWNITWEALN